MKVLLLASFLDRGGAETHVYALARGLAEAGHTVEVASGGGAMSEALKQGGIVHHTVGWHTHHPIRLWRAYRALRRILAAGDYSLIHVHGRIPAFLASMAGRRCDLPMVTTVHARFCAKGLRRRFSCWGQKTIAVSEDLKQYLCEVYGRPSERIAVIPNGIDLCRFSPARREVRQRSDKHTLVFLSRLDKDCSLGATLLCRLAPDLHDRFPSLRIVLVGGGELLDTLRQKAKNVNRRCGAEVVRLTGHKEKPEELLQQATGVLAVSRAALEAMACGSPVILGGDEGFLGLLDKQMLLEKAEQSNFCCRGGERMSEVLLQEHIVRLLSLPAEEREQIGDRCRQWIAEHHSLERMIEQTVSFYRSVERYDPKQRGRVVLCGYYGYGNMGDDALLRESIRLARERFPDLPISALTCHGRKDEAHFGVRCVRRSSPIALWRELRGAEYLIYGGGTLLQDTTSLRSLLYYSALLRLAQHRGIHTELWANGLNAPHTAIGRWMMRRALRGCERIGLRDERSLEIARDLLDDPLSPSPVRQADLALGTPPCGEERIRFLQELYGLRDAEYGYAIVALRGQAPKGYVRIFEEWLATLRAEGVILLFVPMLPKEDLSATLRLCRMLEGRIAYGLDASDLVGLARDSRIVCGMRLHALVFAASAGTPFIGFGGDAKLECFCRENGGVYFTQLYH
ncbi:MAG: glycosyltransferase [Ruminococcaceae bacterium]|nr:glycosyltransferase [Oscillospiraceae bacterium]